MAAVTKLGGTWNTTAGNKTVTATPAVNDLIVIIAGGTGTPTGISCSDNNSSGAYTQIVSSTGGGTAGDMRIFIRTTLIGSAVSTIFTATITGDSGGGLTVLNVASMTRKGSNAAKQSKGESLQTESPPSIAFGSATNTNNPIVLGILGETNPAGLTPPTGFTEHTDVGWATPTTGVEVCSVNSGQTASSYSWSGGTMVDHNEVGVELDTTAPPAGVTNSLLMTGCGI